jgi:hypothetical protein
VRAVELLHSNIPMTRSGIKPATFQPVAQCLNQLRHSMPQFLYLIPFPLENGEFEK